MSFTTLSLDGIRRRTGALYVVEARPRGDGMAITKCLIGEPGCNCAERKEASRTCPAGEPGCDCAEWEEDPWEGVEVEPEPDWWDGPTCTLCDGVGHGYPGSLRPCPLEDRGWGDEPDDRGRW